MEIINIKIKGAKNDNTKLTKRLNVMYQGSRYDDPDTFNERQAIIEACDALKLESTYPDAELLIEWGTVETVKRKAKKKTGTRAARPSAKKKTADMLTRERWLTDLVETLDKNLFPDNVTMPKFRVTCGFPSRGGTALKKKTVGQCWSPDSSSDGTTEIIMTICEDDTMSIAGTVAHEMVHAIVGVDAGHGKPFRDLALQIGLEGKMTSTTESETFKQTVQPLLDKMGAYPHAKLDASAQPKQSTRMIKCECQSCGYVVRTSRKWIEFGAPLCPMHKDQPMTITT